MAKYKFWHIKLFFLVHLYRDTLAIVPNLDPAFLLVDRDLYLTRPSVSLNVVSCVYYNFVENLVKAGAIGYLLVDHVGFVAGFFDDPHVLGVRFD